MQDFIIVVVILCIIASPVMLFLIGQKKIGYINLFTVALFLATWITALARGNEFNWNIITFLWVISLLISTLFLLVVSGFIFFKVAPEINHVLLPLIILAVLVISALMIRYEIFLDVFIFFEIILVYLTPMFLFTILVIGAFQYDRGVGR
ncbi:hypothetical protein [Bacillus sp. CHD6a]|uniref:hypothetical protein n=1 Tax=Bacillus sp. CHD6a TaxID=1643452 RepID=UPI0006CE1698|nr:hypothetical protein [Bacillus sp. CHD6a]KPB03274.1 hypothetical protein AAV98_18385 [Bacillus sp. CHD6a]